MDQLEEITVVCISDTHTHHQYLQLPPGDILIHSGDLSYSGTSEEIESFAIWLDKQKQFKHKIVIAGNHDVTLDKENYEKYLKKKFHNYKKQTYDSDAIKNRLRQSCVYLEDDSATVMGYKIYGSPYTPAFCEWAFQINETEAIEKWKKIPEDTEILITHGPPKGKHDKVTFGGENVGCQALLDVIQKVKPLYHIFGHIHEAYGQSKEDGTTFINCATCTLKYIPTNLPVVFKLPKRI